MNTKARITVLLGAGLLAGAMAAGPAQAAPAPPPPPNQGDVVGLFQSRPDCDWAGRAGEALHRWNDPSCDFVTFGPYRGWWILRVDRFGSTGWPGNGHGHGHGGGHGPGHH